MRSMGELLPSEHSALSVITVGNWGGNNYSHSVLLPVRQQVWQQVSQRLCVLPVCHRCVTRCCSVTNVGAVEFPQKGQSVRSKETRKRYKTYRHLPVQVHGEKCLGLSLSPNTLFNRTQITPSRIFRPLFLDADTLPIHADSPTKGTHLRHGRALSTLSTLPAISPLAPKCRELVTLAVTANGFFWSRFLS